ncbi:MAG: 30S ribosomal protein S4 [Andreesenia angusta]|nr:30S ribosomal protein S4 [Andreesenia angusta]
MARPMGPRFKLCRRFGVNIFDHPKALERGTKDNRKVTEYGKQLTEKQKLKAYYGVMEKQMLKYVRAAFKSDEQPGTALVKSLEKRLDNVVYRIGLASSLRQARQMVVHGHVKVNGKKVDIPSYAVSVGDTISLKEKSREVELFKSNIDLAKESPSYIEVDRNNFEGKLVREPEREEVPIFVTDSLVVEYYSKNM